MKSFLKLTRNGIAETFEGDLPLKGKVTRVSHIWPDNLVLRTAFIFLRIIFGDNGRVAAWTRKWPGKWVIKYNGQYFGPFDSRRKAIEIEREMVVNDIKRRFKK